jgi:ribosomal protein S18 acetylase RimI-like enzyme
MGPIEVRAARPSDLPVIVAFNAAMAKETEGRDLDVERLESGVRGLFARPDRGFYLVAERGGAVVGQLMITYEWSDWRDADFWWIQSVYVAPEHRRQGAYSALQAEAERRAGADGACGLRLYVDRDNAHAQETYRSLGFERTRYELYESAFDR